MNLGVVITTYNKPSWLEKVFWGYENQTDEVFEVIVADDGSGAETKDLIDRFVARGRLKIRHVWHEDEGFRKTEILNKAIVATDCDYLVFTDGDCIPRRDFVQVHKERAKPGCFLSGGYLKLNMAVSEALSEEDVSTQRAFDVDWLIERGQPKSSKMSKLTARGWKRKFLECVTPTKATWNGMNSSGWRSDILAVNGFNEEMQYGGLDRELGERMMNLGIKPTQIRYSAICLHLDHARGYAKPEIWAKNRAIRKRVIREKSIWTSWGIDKKGVMDSNVGGGPRCSLIISIYKNIEALALVLESIRSQSVMPDEIIVSEDGDSPEVKAFIEGIEFPLEIRHLSHPDVGWQKSIALNNAIREASHEYLIFIDGDCFLHERFIEFHLKEAAPKSILAGKRIKLDNESSTAILNREIPLQSLNSHILRNFRTIKRRGGRFLEEGLFIDPRSWLGFIPRLRTMYQLKGCNMSFYKSAIEKINGFDEEYTRPAIGEDIDLTWRFEGCGFRLKSVRNLAVQYHLHHKENWTDQSLNVELMKSKQKRREFVCSQGLKRLE